LLLKKKQRSEAKGVYRDAGKLVVREGARFPRRCAICNKPCDGDSVDFTFGRETSHYIDVAAVQAVTRAAADLVTRTRYTGPVHVEIPLCSWHRTRRLRRLGIGLGVLALASAFLGVHYAISGPAVFGGAGEFGLFFIPVSTIIAVLVGLVSLAIALSALVDATKIWFKPTRFYGRFVWLQGAGLEFLRTLPRIEDHHYKLDSGDPGLGADELIRRGGVDED
jgi:hypothetical protein